MAAVASLADRINNHNEILDEFFQLRYKDEMASDRFKALSPDEQQELCDKARESLRAGLERLAGMIERRDVALWVGHTLNPDNRMYRRLFERLTGEKLPAGAKATQEFVAAFVGRAAIDGYVQAKQKAAEAKEAERAASVHKELDAIVARIKAGEAVSGSDLVRACRHVGIDVHPRTAGTLKARVVSITADTARIIGKRLSNEPYKLYMAVATGERENN